MQARTCRGREIIAVQKGGGKGRAGDRDCSGKQGETGAHGCTVTMIIRSLLPAMGSRIINHPLEAVAQI